MKKQILLFGAGKSATYLIAYLLDECLKNEWHLTVADSNLLLAQSKTARSGAAKAVAVLVENGTERTPLIIAADIVISLLPPSLHHLVAGDCLEHGKNLLTASYLDEKITGMQDAIKNKGLLFLCEMGLDPGIDHMSAMKILHHVEREGGTVHSFRSHCGGLVAPETDDNPWHFKISWNPKNIALAGSAGAVYLEENKEIHKAYAELFQDCKQLEIDGIGTLAYYPNRDSLSYIPLYMAGSAKTFLRTTLRYPAFCKAWHYLVLAGLTNNEKTIETQGLRFSQWAEPLRSLADPSCMPLYDYLGLFDEELVPQSAKTGADIMQYLLEKRLSMQAGDRDMVVMLHQIEFELSGKNQLVESLLVVKGEDSLRTAMAKTVGLPLGIATRLILQNKIHVKGLHIPILPEIYEPVLEELAANGIVFRERSIEA